MTIEEATKIADEYCKNNYTFCYAIYRGKYNDGLLFKISSNGSGHRGRPEFVIINSINELTLIDVYNEKYYEVWDASIEYATSINRQ